MVFSGKDSNNFVSLSPMALSDNIPKYILSKKQMSFNVVFTALFSIVTDLLLSPLSINNWFVLTEGNSTIITIAFWALCFLILILSRQRLYFLRNKDITILFYIFWCLCEMLLISLLYMSVSLLGASQGWLVQANCPPFESFLHAFIFCIFGLGIPNLISILYCAVSEKDQTIRLMNFSNVVSDTEASPQNAKRITLYDNSGVLKLVINQNNLYYIESDDNYIKVWYQDSYSELKQYMLRCRLKTIEESFAESDLVRCHRKYIVNINKVEQMSRQKDGTFSLDLGMNKIDPIPVSKTYEEGFLARFNSR